MAPTTGLPATVTLTRTRLLVLLAGLLAATTLVAGGTAWAVGTFKDVPPSHPFYDEIEWGAAHGIIEGYPDGTFRPANPVTRQAQAAFLSRYNASIHLVESSTNPAAGLAWSHQAVCPSGERAVAGGGSTDIFNMFITDSWPSSPDRWTTRWESEGNAILDPGKISAWALCLPEAP